MKISELASRQEKGTGFAPSARRSLSKLVNAGGLLFVIIALVTLIGITAPNFFSPFNIFTLTRSAAIDAVIGFAMMVVLALGHMNLAVGAIGVCAVMTTGWTLQQLGLPIPLAIVAAIVLGAILGVINGITIVQSGLHSFIITMATASLYTGGMLILTRAEAFRNLPTDFSSLSSGRIGWVSNYIFVAIIITAALLVLFNFSVLGRNILSTGANPVAARLSGIPTSRIIIIAHMISGILAAIAGIMVAARSAAALPSAGDDWLLLSFLAPLLGGTLLTGGYVSVLGALLGAVLLTIMQNGLVMLNVSGFWISFFLGLALLAAVGIDRWRGLYAESAVRTEK